MGWGVGWKHSGVGRNPGEEMGMHLIPRQMSILEAEREAHSC